MITKFNPMVDLNIKNIEKYINWKDLIRNEKLDESLIEYYNDMFRLEDIIQYQKVSQDFLEDNILLIKKLGLWRDVCCYQNLTEDFMETNQDELEWNCISQYQKLSEEFIIRFYNRINWFWATLFQELSIDILETLIEDDKIDWSLVGKYQVLNEGFVDKYIHNLDINDVVLKTKLSDEFLYLYRNKLSKDTLLNRNIVSEKLYHKINDNIPPGELQDNILDYIEEKLKRR